MKKYLRKFKDWLTSQLQRKEEVIEKDIPVEDAFRMWKEEQRKK